MKSTTFEFDNLVMNLQSAWNAADASKFASHFAEDADFIHILGGQGSGRNNIQQAHAKLFETIYRGSEISYTIEGARWLGPKTAIVRMFQSLEYSMAGARQIMHCRPTAVVQRTITGWEILIMQNTRVAEPENAKIAEIVRAHPFALSTA